MSKIFAYFDPGSGSLLVQLLLGGLCGLAVLARYLWHSLRDRKERFGRRPPNEGQG